MPGILVVPLTQGDSPTPTFKITAGGAQLNLSALDVDAIIKPSVDVDDDDETAIHLTVGDGLTVVDAAAGAVSLEVPPSVTQDPSWWAFRIRVIADSKPETAIKGLFHVADS